MKTTTAQTLKSSNGLALFISSKKTIYNDVLIPPDLKRFVLSVISSKDANADESKTVYTHTNVKDFPSVAITFIKDEKKLKNNSFRKMAATVAKSFQNKKITDISFVLPDLENIKTTDIISEITEGVYLSTYQYTELITDKKRIKSEISNLTLVSSSSDKSHDKIIERSLKIAESVCFTRDLVNTPPSRLNPTRYVKIAKQVSKDSNLNLHIMDKKELTEKGMECLLGVGRGSSEDPKMIILEYKPKKFKNKKPIILVGKGITYDAGGVNLKPSSGGMIELMKDDMAGSATVLSVINLCSQLNLDLHVYSILAVSENMLGSSAYKPGDVLKAYNGKTVEIKNTDAEGRLALADALSYASKDLKPETMIDVATLTGASIIALGWDITPFLSNNEKLSKKLVSSSKSTGEKIWELPLDECYKKYMKGDISDLKNVPGGRNAGVNTAAIFLEEFVDNNIAWTHFDIGGTVLSNRKMPYEPKGATGSMVRLLLDFLENY